MSFLDGLERFAGEVEKFFKGKPEALNLRSCKNCPYYQNGYCTQTSPPTRILSEYYAQGCIYYGAEMPVIGKDVTELATKADVESMKADISAMRATLGSVGVMRTAQLIEKKGGSIGFKTDANDETEFAGSSSYGLNREFNVPTPTPPTNMIVYNFALMISVELKGATSPYNIACRIDVDGETIAEILSNSSAYIWFDRAVDVDAGSHNVKIYLKRVSPSITFMRKTRAKCGIGTTEITEIKVAQLQTSGQGKGSYVIASEAYEAPATVTGVLKADESEADMETLDVEVTADGSTYSNNAELSTMVLQLLSLYCYTSSGNVASFLQWFESTFLMAMGAE